MIRYIMDSFENAAEAAVHMNPYLKGMDPEELVDWAKEETRRYLRGQKDEPEGYWRCRGLMVTVYRNGFSKELEAKASICPFTAAEYIKSLNEKEQTA